MTIEQAMNPTIEEAIQRFEGMVFTSDLSPSTLRAIAVNKLALSALRERAEREKGCDLCIPRNTISSMGAYGRKFQFCPMCGRKLK